MLQRFKSSFLRNEIELQPFNLILGKSNRAKFDLINEIRTQQNALGSYLLHGTDNYEEKVFNFENDLHHTEILEHLEKYIAIASRGLQCFISTQSRDVIEICYDVFSKREPYDLAVIRLQDAGFGLEAVSFDKDEFRVAIENRMEIR